MIKTRIELVVLTSFNSLDIIFSQYNFFFSKIKKDIDISIINISNLGFSISEKKNEYFKNKSLGFEKRNPKNFSDFKRILKEKQKNGKKLIFMDDVPRRYNFFLLFLLLKKLNIPGIVLANIGNIQPPHYYYKINYLNFLNIFFFRKVPRALYYFFSIFGFFPKTEILFLSNKNLFKILKRKENSFFSRIKKVILLNYFNKTHFKKKLSNRYILLIEKDIRYLIKYKKYKININEKEYKSHFNKNYQLLKKLCSYYKKKPIVSIHPNYNFKFISKEYREIKVFKGNTKKFIHDSFFVLFFDSSVIIEAINLNKKIINIKSEIFNKKKVRTDIYNRYLKILTIENSDKNIKFNKIDNYLNKKNNYQKFLKTYISPKKNNFNKKKFINCLKKI